MKKLTILFCLFTISAHEQTGRSATGSSINNKALHAEVFIGTVAQLRALNTSQYIAAQTTDFGGGDWDISLNDNTSADNGGTVIVDASGKRWKRRYTGLDEVKWYYATPGTDSAVVRRANENCRQGLHFDTLVYNLHKFRPRSNRIYEGTPGKTVWRLTDASANDPKDWRAIVLFNDSATKSIKNVSFTGITFNGNSDNQINPNSVLVRFGGNFGSSGTDTSENITFDNTVWDSCKGQASLWLLSDTNRNRYIVVKNSVFKNAQKGHVQLRGSRDMTFDNVEWYNWTIADSSASSCFGGTSGSKNQPACVRLTIKNCKAYNNKGIRFTFEISGTVLSSNFYNIECYGNGRNVNGFSGPGWFGCTWDNVKQFNGGGGHRSGYEIVGADNKITNFYIENGSLTIGSNPRSTSPPPVGFDSLLNSGFIVNTGKIINSKGGGIGIGGHDSLRNVTIKNVEVNSSLQAINFFGGVRDCVIEDCKMTVKGLNAVKFYNTYWSAADSISQDIVFRNNVFNSPGLGAGYPTVTFNAPVATTLAKYRNITFENNQYSQPNLYYKDSTINTWKLKNNARSMDTTIEKLKKSNSILFSKHINHSSTIEKPILPWAGTILKRYALRAIYKNNWCYMNFNKIAFIQKRLEKKNNKAIDYNIVTQIKDTIPV